MLLKRLKSTHSSLSNLPLKTQITSLPSGIRVASEDTPGHFAAVGVFVDAGSRYEIPPYLGVSHFCEKLAFKSTKNMSRDKVMNVLEKVGGNVACNNSREHIMYQASVFKHDIPEMLSMFADMIHSPLITREEIEEAKSTILYELESAYSKPEWKVLELSHQAAFKGNTYGLSTICTPETLDTVTKENLFKYRSLFYRPRNLVVAGVGMQHEQLCEWTENYFQPFSSMNSFTDEPERRNVLYTGGEIMHEDSTMDLTRIFIGFNAPSFSHDNVYPLSVLQIMLGGGDSFSAGGPGKGMYSRLYMDVLNRYHWIESITAINTPYKDAGLFGFQATVPHNAVSNMMTVIGNEIRKVLDKPIEMEELERAKNQLRSSLFMNLETKMVHLEDLGRQVQMQGFRVTPREMSDKIEQVTQDDIKKVFGEMIKQKPTLMVLGTTKFVPSLKRFEKVFGIGTKHGY